MIAGMTYYQICMYFLLYSFGGWIVEVMYHAVAFGKIINRGFLNGPVCPVYGFGMLAVLAAGNAVTSSTSALSADISDMNTGLLFIFGFVLATLVELIAGWALDKLFHARWWDYSNKPFNFHGYICLEFSILWGLAIVLVVKLIHPMLNQYTADAIPPEYGWPIMAVLYAAYLADLIITVLTVSGMNRKIREVDHVRQLMRMPSDKLSEVVGSTTLSGAQHLEEGQVQAALARSEIKQKAEEVKEDLHEESVQAKRKREMEISAYKQKLSAKADEMMNELVSGSAFGSKRLFKAFPTLHSDEYEEIVEELKKRAADEKKKK